ARFAGFSATLFRGVFSYRFYMGPMSAFGPKRTSQRGREHVDETRMTQSGHEASLFVAMHAHPMHRRLGQRRDSLTLTPLAPFEFWSGSFGIGKNATLTKSYFRTVAESERDADTLRSSPRSLART